MDVINKVINPSVEDYITINGFYRVGKTYRYAVLPIFWGYEFLDSGKKFLITRRGEIKTFDSVKIVPVITDKVSVGSLGSNDNEDDICFQSAFNLAKLRDCNVDVNVDIKGFIDIYRDGSHEAFI